MLFFQGVHVCTACKNSSFCTVLRYKMLLLQALHVCTPWSNSFFCTVLHGLPTPAPAHLIGSPNPLVSRAPQTLTQKRLEQAPGIPPACAMSKKASRGSWALEAPGSRPAASQPPACVSSLPPLRAADGHGAHGPQPLHVLGRAVHRLVGPRVVGAPLPALARHPRGQALLQRLDARSSVANSLPRSVVTTKFPSSPVSSRAARLVARPTVSAFLFCRGSTAASRVKTSITTRPYFVFPRVFWLKSMRSACSRSFGPSAADLPSARGRGAGPRRPSAPRRPWPASRRGRAASRVGTASAGPAR